MTTHASLITDEDLPDQLAIFPLSGALLLPFGRLPLNIFEPRYLALVSDCLGQGRLMGMVQPLGAAGETVDDTAPVYDVGCLGRVTQFTETEGGQFAIALNGLCRFRIRRELDLHNGYRRIVPDFLEFLTDLSAPGGRLDNRAPLLDALKGYVDARALTADWPAFDETPDAALVTSMAMACPFKPEEKQLLLEAGSLTARAEQLQAILEMAVHEQTSTAARH